MNPFRKVFFILIAILLIALVGGILFIQLYFSDERLREIAEPLLEEQLDRKITIGEFDLGFFRSFPNVSLGINDIAIHAPERGTIPSTDLANIGRIWIDLPLLPILRGKVEVKSLELHEPQILVEIYDDLSSNLLELAETSTDTVASEPNRAAESTEIALETIQIRDGIVGYVHADGTLMTLEGVNADLSARLHENAELEGWLYVDNSYLEMGGITYVDHWGLGLDILAQANLDSAWLKLEKANFTVQDLVLELSGEVVDFDSDEMGVDLSFNAPEASVASFWSLLPSYVVQDLTGIESDGVFSVNGTISGDLAEGVFPRIHADMKVADGVIRYPDLPSSIRNLSMDAQLTDTKFDVRSFTAEADGAKLNANAIITEFTNPSLSTNVDLSVDLSSMHGYYPVDEGTKLDGSLLVKAQVNGALEQIDNLSVSGIAEMVSIDYQSPLLEQPIEDLNGRILLDKQQVEFENISLISGESDLSFEGVLTGIEGFFADSMSSAPYPALIGSMKSSFLNVTEYISEDTTSSFVGPLELPPLQLDVKIEAETIEFNEMKFSDATGTLTLERGIIGFENIQTGFLGGILSAAGSFDVSDAFVPAFNGKVAFSDMPVNEFFSAFPQMNAIVHLGSYLEGLFNSSASFGLELDKDLKPLYRSAVAQGVFGTQESSFGTMPLQSVVAGFTGVDELKSLNIADWSHSFSVSGERLYVQDLQFNAGEYVVSLNGSQSFDGGLDYRLSVELPESASDVLAQSPAQGALGTVSNIANATLKNPETGRITLDMLASGTFLDPSIKLDSEKMKARLSSSIVEGIKTEAETRIDSLEQSARERAETELLEQRERLEDRAEEEVEELVEGLVDSTTVPASLDSLKEKGTDILKDRLNGLIKRRKKNN